MIKVLNNILKDCQKYKDKYEEMADENYYKGEDDDFDYVKYYGMANGIDSCIRRIQREIRNQEILSQGSLVGTDNYAKALKKGGE